MIDWNDPQERQRILTELEAFPRARVALAAELMMEDAIQISRDLARDERIAFDRKYGDFWKCTACGGYVQHGSVDTWQMPWCCHRRPVRIGYAPPP